MVTDTSKIKENIIKFLENNGPSLPIHIAKSIQMEMMFTSAFLAELIREQKIFASYMRVGSSPIYFLKQNQKDLGKFSEYLKGKEKETYLKLKENKFLIEENEQPATQVALKEIKDFAKSFSHNQKIIWRFFLNEEKEFVQKEPKKEIIQNQSILIEEKIKEEPQTDLPKLFVKDVKKTLEKENLLLENKKEIKPIFKKEKLEKPIIKKKKTSTKKNEKFFNTVKEHLARKQMEIIDIIIYDSKFLILQIKSNNEEKLLIAFPKKRVTEQDILSAYKKIEDSTLDFIILSLGEPAKKTQNIINIAKKIDSFNKIG